MTTAAQFLALSPVAGVKYVSSTLDAYGWLDEDTNDVSGEKVWTPDGAVVFVDHGVVEDNTYWGERTAPVRIDLLTPDGYLA